MNKRTIVAVAACSIALSAAITNPAAAATSHVTNQASKYSDTGVILHACDKTKYHKNFGPASIAQPGQKVTFNFDYAKSGGCIRVYVPKGATAVVTDYWGPFHHTENLDNNTNVGQDMCVAHCTDVAGDRIYTNIVK